jgi:hypothetical protein
VADFNTAGLAALNAQLTNVRWMAWLDITSDVVRVTTAPVPLTFAGPGDADLDGNTFGRTDGLISVSEVVNQAGGAQTVTAFLSALPGIDTAALNAIGTKSNYQGRTARLWMVILDPDTNAIVAVAPYFTGYMNTPKIAGSISAQTISMEIESYLPAIADASNRTYLDQAQFDSGDTSAAATIAAANGFSAAGNVGTGAGGGGGGRDGRNEYIQIQ